MTAGTGDDKGVMGAVLPVFLAQRKKSVLKEPSHAVLEVSGKKTKERMG